MWQQALRPILAAVSVAAVSTVALSPGSALAHEHRTIGGGKYDVVVGWDAEPAYQDQKNAASIRLSEAASNPAIPVEGADKTLKVQIRQGATTREFPLRAVFDQKGYYVADLVPTHAGHYQWTFVGSVNGDLVNETFDSADGKFDKVDPISGLQFPVALPDPAQAAAVARDAQAEAQGARTLGGLGIGVGALGLLAALGAWATRPRVTATTTTTRPAGEPI